MPWGRRSSRTFNDTETEIRVKKFASQCSGGRQQDTTFDLQLEVIQGEVRVLYGLLDTGLHPRILPARQNGLAVGDDQLP